MKAETNLFGLERRYSINPKQNKYEFIKKGCSLMKRTFIFSLFLLIFGVFSLTPSNIVHATENYPSTHPTKAYSVSNAEAFRLAEEQGIDVKSILSEEEYQTALFNDRLRAGVHGVYTYVVGKETRIFIGVDSALVKVWKYGGRAAIYAIQAYGALSGMPLDPMVANGMHNTLQTINDSKGYYWYIGTSPWRIISHGSQ